MTELRRHVIEMHPRIARKLPRSNADLVKAHRKEHHHYRCTHHHGFTAGPHDRPIGWTTGENAVPRT